MDGALAWLPPLLAAPFIGSVLGVLIRRLPAGQPVVVARSVCEACRQPLSPFELVPILSFVLQRGRCRTCGAPIAPMHLAIELAAFAIAAIAAAALADPVALWLGCALGWTTLTLAWIDVEHLRLPDVLILPLIPAGLAATWILEPDMLTGHALGAVIGYGAMRGLAAGYHMLRGRDGLGQGDAKLMAAAGAWAGLTALPSILTGAAMLTLGWAAVERLRGATANAQSAFPLGPGISVALWAVWLWQVSNPSALIAASGWGL